MVAVVDLVNSLTLSKGRGHAGAYSNTVNTLPRDVVVWSVLQYHIYTNKRYIVTSQGTVSQRCYTIRENPSCKRILRKMSVNCKKMCFTNKWRNISIIH